MSHDPSAYFNPDSKVFEVSKSEEGVLGSLLERELNFVPDDVPLLENEEVDLGIDMNGAFAKCVALTNQKFEFIKWESE